MDISVVIPAYNYADAVGRAIESVMLQEGGEFEAVVVDDGSTDDTPAILSRYQQQYKKRLTCVRQTNAGVSAARNRGIDIARGDYVLFLDADDQLLPGGLRRLLSAARSNPEADLIIGGRQVDNGRKVRERCNTRLPESRRECFLASINNEIEICNGCFMVRRPVLAEIRYPEELRNMEDPVFRGLLFANVEAVCIRDPVMICFRHAGSLRYDLDSQRGAVEQVVSALFDHPKMPKELAGFRSRVAASHYLGGYRRLIEAGCFHEALACYRSALKLSPRSALRLTYLSKALRGWIKQLRA